MLNTFTSTLAMLALATSASAADWTLDGSSSKLSFGSVKIEDVAEVHTFPNLTGTVGADGAVQIDIDLASVQTNIDIRNERMNEHVFKGMASASLTGQIDMAAMDALAVGGTMVQEMEITLGFLGEQVPLDASLFVARLSETDVMVTTDSMVFVTADDLGISEGIDTLQELAGLDSITRAVPVTLRLMFAAGGA